LYRLFYLVGLGGYLYALDETRDNILLNFPMNDSAVLLGRMGFCFTLLFGLPLVALPCREAFRAIPGQIRNWRIDAALAKEFKQVDQHRLHEGAHLVINGVDFDKADPTMVTEDPEKQHLTMMTYGATHEMEHVIGSRDEDEQTMASTSDADTGERSKLLDDEGSSDQSTFLDVEPIIHFVSTALVVGVCYSFAISVPGVGFVWSLAGSSMAILVAFIVPTACYLKIRQHKYVNPRSIAAWALLIISCIAAPICTRQALLNNGK
jgi:amino acid permease